MVSIIPIPRLSLQIILKTIPTTQKINVHGIFFKRFIFRFIFWFIFRCPFLYRQVLPAAMITNVVFITCTLFVNTNLYVYKTSIVPDTNGHAMFFPNNFIHHPIIFFNYLSSISLKDLSLHWHEISLRNIAAPNLGCKIHKK